MEQRDIEVFLAVADELHFGRAAESLRVSTSRVNRTIRTLERRIGGALFERTSRRVRLTPLGTRLAEDLRPAHRQILDAVALARATAGAARSTLRVGFIGAASGRFVLDVAEAFRAGHPGVDVGLREIQFGQGFALLRGGEVDLALATVPARGAEQALLRAGRVLTEEGQLLAVPARHRFARRASVSFADLARTTVLRTPPTIPAYWDDELVPSHTADGRPVERGPVFDTTQEMLALIGAGIGTCPVSAQFTSHYVRPDVIYVPISDAPPYQRRLFWLRGAETATIRDFDRGASAVSGTG